MIPALPEGAPMLLFSLLALAACAPQPEAPTVGQVAPAAAEADTLRALRASPPPEADLPPTDEGHWSLACGAALTLEPGGQLQLFTREGVRPLEGVTVGEPAVSADGKRLAWSRAPSQPPETEIAVLACEGGAWAAPCRLAGGPGSPDRVAITPDGAWVLWFSSAGGVPALWAAPFAGGDPKQITNRGVTREGAAPGQPPAGFVPPPHMGAPRVEALGDGRYLARWEAPDGPHTAELP
ncbi:MAG: hypothetical protein ABIO70_17540 [Pseudomonadota bacterium]